MSVVTIKRQNLKAKRKEDKVQTTVIVDKEAEDRKFQAAVKTMLAKERRMMEEMAGIAEHKEDIDVEKIKS